MEGSPSFSPMGSPRRWAGVSMLALALALAAAGCNSGEGRTDLPGEQVDDLEAKLQELERHKRYRLYYLGQSFQGFALSHIEYDREPYRGVGFIYGTCEPGAFADGGCAPPLEVQTWPACGPNRPDARTARRGLRIRGALAGAQGGGLTLYTGNVTVTIFGMGRRDAADALRPVGADVPRPRLPTPTRAALEGRVTCG